MKLNILICRVTDNSRKGLCCHFTMNAPTLAGLLALAVKNLPATAGDAGVVGSIPGLGRCSGGRNGNPLQYSCLENSTDRGARLATGHGVTESQTWLSDWTHAPFAGEGQECKLPCLESFWGSFAGTAQRLGSLDPSGGGQDWHCWSRTECPQELSPGTSLKDTHLGLTSPPDWLIHSWCPGTRTSSECLKPLARPQGAPPTKGPGHMTRLGSSPALLPFPFRPTVSLHPESV